MAKAIRTAIIATFVVVTGALLASATPFFALAEGALASMAAYTFATTLVAAGIGQITSKGVQATAGNFGTKFATRSPSAPKTNNIR